MKTSTERRLFDNPDWVRDILNTSSTGLWSICVNTKTGKAGMFASAMMLELLGLDDHPSPDVCYHHWFSRIDPPALQYVQDTVDRMIQTGEFMEVQYLWHHPVWGDIHIRCGGKLYFRADNEIELRGYHQNISELVDLKQENLLKKRELEEVGKEKQRYNALFESMLCGIVQYRYGKDRKAVFKNANPEAIRILGYTEEAFRLKESWDFVTIVHPDDRERVLGEIDRLEKAGDKTHFEFRLIQQDGTPCWIIGSVEIIVDVDGEEVYQSVFLDIDDSKKTEIENAMLAEQVSAGNELLRISLEHTATSEFYYYPETRRLIVTERTQQRYGCRACYDDMPDSFADDFVADDSRDVFFAMYERIHAGEKTATADLHGRAGDVWCRVTLSTVTTKDGKPAFVVGLVEDITRARTIELENTHLHAIYDYIMNNDYDLMGVADLEKGQYSLRFSDKMDSRGMPLSGEIVEGNYQLLDRFVHPDDRERIEREWALERVLHELERRDSYSYYFLSSENPPRYKEGKVSYFNGFRDRLILTFRDIHDMRLKEEQVRQTLTDALTVARQANNARSDFLSKMSHDMRTPMNGIIGLATIASHYVDDAERMKAYLSKISMASHHLLGLINDVLDMSKIDSGKIMLVEEDFDLVSLVDDVVSIMMPDVRKKQQELKVSVEADVRSRVRGDPLRLRQVFMNLLSNAVKFTPDGGHIGIALTESASVFDGVGHYRLVFSDDGIGMSPAFLERLFVPFEREENSMTSKTTGTGLGMTISRAIVEMMNGSIEVESERGRGTVFTVTVHLKHQPAASTAVSDAVEQRTILVVIDDPAGREKAGLSLAYAEMRVEMTGSPDHAFSLAEAAHEAGRPFVAVVFDLTLPDEAVVERVRRFRSCFPELLLLLVVTGDENGAIQARRAGADVALVRPVTPSTLKASLHALLARSAGEVTAGEVTDFSGRRVLLVEDNELNQEIAAEMLKMIGVTVDTAENGRQALEKIAASPEGYFDLVFMDIQMPVMDGYEATRQIRQLSRKDVGTLPIVAMTANAFPEDIRHAQDAGMDAHLAKPIGPDSLYAVMSRWLKG